MLGNTIKANSDFLFHQKWKVCLRWVLLLNDSPRFPHPLHSAFVPTASICSWISIFKAAFWRRKPVRWIKLAAVDVAIKATFVTCEHLLLCESVKKEKKKTVRIDRVCVCARICVFVCVRDWLTESAGGRGGRMPAREGGGAGGGWRLDAGEQRHSERGGSTVEEDGVPRWACFHGNLRVNCWDLYRDGGGGGWAAGFHISVCMYVT